MNEEAVPAGHPHDDDLRLYILGRLAATKIEVLERHVFQCPACQDRLASITRMVSQLGQPMVGGGLDTRSDPRSRISRTGFLRSLVPLVLSRWPVQIVDISKNGLGLLVPIYLAKGTLVQVQIGDAFALGEVRYSQQTDEHQFHAGIQLIDTVGAI